jgi:hypothetical protein
MLIITMVVSCRCHHSVTNIAIMDICITLILILCILTTLLLNLLLHLLPSSIITIYSHVVILILHLVLVFMLFVVQPIVYDELFHVVFSSPSIGNKSITFIALEHAA